MALGALPGDFYDNHPHLTMTIDNRHLASLDLNEEGCWHYDIAQSCPLGIQSFI